MWRSRSASSLWCPTPGKDLPRSVSSSVLEEVIRHPMTLRHDEYGRPLVTGRPRPTAHPSTEAWRSVQFSRLQMRMTTIEAAAGVTRERRSVVVVPSRQIDRWHEPPAETEAYEERLLSSLLELG